MRGHGRRRGPGDARRVPRQRGLWLCAVLLSIAHTSHAGPHWEYEAGIQTVQTVLDESYPSLGTPVSGFVAIGASIWQGPDARAVLKLGYDDEMSRNEFASAIAYYDEDVLRDRQSLRTQSVW